MAPRTHIDRPGISLVKGPVAIVGLVLVAFGITGLLFGGHDFVTRAPSGTVNGEPWLGIEVNGWSNVLCIAAGALLLLAAPLHWEAKAMALIVGLALGAASVIAIVDGSDVFGIFAANGWTELGWGVTACVLLGLALLPRVGRRRVVAEPAPVAATEPPPVPRTGRFRRRRAVGGDRPHTRGRS